MAKPTSALERGFTLLELTVLLMIVGLLISLAVPPIRSGLDQLAVIAAQDEAMAIVHQARARARIDGGARIELLPDSVMEVWSADTLRVRWNGRAQGVALAIGRDRAAQLRWDALGVGVVASRTLTLSRGRAVRKLILSSTGRVVLP